MNKIHKQQKINQYLEVQHLVGNELFWGDDRLEDAIEWARK